MNSFEFYSKLQQYKDKSTLSHASIPASYKKLATGLNNMKNYGYYNKIDNFYGPGKSRYFYSKDEWDAYQREKDAMYQKAKDEVRKKNEEQVQKEIDKYSNVNAAQNARAKEEKKGTYAIRENYIKSVNDKLDKSYDMYKDILKVIKESGHNTDSWINDTLQKNLPKGYHVRSDGDITVDLAKAYPDIYVKKKMIDTKEARLDFGVDDPKNESIKNYKERKTDIDYERTKLMEEFNEKYYKALSTALHHLVDDNAKDKTNNIKNALWEMANSKDYEKYRGKIYDQLFSYVKYYGFKKPTTSNTTNWGENSKTWDDGSVTLYENIIPENILTENIVKENIVPETIIKEATVKPIEVKPIEVKKIKIK